MGLRMPSPWKHPDSGTYYLFERIPKRLIGAAKGKSVLLLVDGQACPVKLGQHVKLSLRTKDIATAKERYRDASAALQEHLRVIQQTAENGPVRLTQRQTEAIAGDYYRDLTSQHGNEPGSPKEWDAGLTAVQEPDPAGLDRMHGEDADRLLMGRGLVVDEDSRARLLQSMHRAFVQFGEQQVRRGSGDWSPDARADRFPAFEDGATGTCKPSAVASDKATGPTLTGLFEAWEKDAKAKGVVDKTTRDFRQKLVSLIAFIGHDRIGDMTPQDIVTWTDPLGDGLNPFMDERSRTVRLMVDLLGSAMERKVDAQLPT